MSRDRKQNESAVNNTLAFLREVKERCEAGTLRSITWLTDKHEVSHNSGAACKELKVIVVEGDVYKWVLKGDPGRYLALEILDNLLHRSKKKVDVPLLPDFATKLDAIAERLGIIATQNESAFKPSKSRMLDRALAQAPMNSNGLFSESESKQAVKNDLLKTAIMSLYTGRDLATLTQDTVSIINGLAIGIVDDVYNKFYAAK